MGSHLSEPGHLASTANLNSVYRYFDHAERLIYIGITARGIQRQQEHEKLSDWFEYASTQQIERCPDRASALTLERELIKAYRPPFNKVHNGEWGPVRAAYLAVVAAEKWLTDAQAGAKRPDPCGGDVCSHDNPDAGPCPYGVTEYQRGDDLYGEDGCRQVTCDPCHARFHGVEAGIPTGWEAGRLGPRREPCGHCAGCEHVRDDPEFAREYDISCRLNEPDPDADLCPKCGRLDCPYTDGVEDGKTEGWREGHATGDEAGYRAALEESLAARLAQGALWIAVDRTFGGDPVPYGPVSIGPTGRDESLAGIAAAIAELGVHEATSRACDPWRSNSDPVSSATDE